MSPRLCSFSHCETTTLLTKARFFSSILQRRACRSIFDADQSASCTHGLFRAGSCPVVAQTYSLRSTFRAKAQQQSKSTPTFLSFEVTRYARARFPDVCAGCRPLPETKDQAFEPEECCLLFLLQVASPVELAAVSFIGSGRLSHIQSLRRSQSFQGYHTCSDIAAIAGKTQSDDSQDNAAGEDEGKAIIGRAVCALSLSWNRSLQADPEPRVH